MSIGDSALDFFSEEEIKKEKQLNQFPNDKYIITSIQNEDKFKKYQMISIRHLKSDKKYFIASLGGVIFFKDNIEKCHPQKKVIEKEFDEVFNSASKKSARIKKTYDKSGNSFADITEYTLLDGSVIQVTCDDWSQKLTDENYLIDALNINLQSSAYRKFLLNEAYK